MLDKIRETANVILYLAGFIMLFLISLHYQGYVEEDIIRWAVIFLICSVLINRRLEVDLEFLILLSALVSYGIVFSHYYSNTEYWQNWRFQDTVWPPVLMYLLCRQLCWKQKEKRLEGLLLAVCFGTFLYSVLNHTIYMKEGFPYGGRIWDEYWTHSMRYATEFSYWGIFITGLSGYGVFCLSRKKWIQGLLICILVVVENYIQIVVDNRMVLMVTIVVAAVSAVLYAYLNRNDRKKLKILVLSTAAMVAVILIILAANVGGVRDTTFFINLMTRDGGILKNIRFQMMWEAMCMLPSHWKGGGTMYPAGLNCVHNYWLQAANDTGIFTFILWMIFNISMLASLFTCIRSSKISQKIKYMIVPLMAAVISYLSLEIGGQGESEYIIFYVMIVAILRQLVKNEKYEIG